MTSLYRVRVALTGFPGGPGVATHYFLDVDTALPSLKILWTALGLVMPGTVTIQIQNAGDIINDVNGDITGAWTATAETAITGGGSGTYSAPSGLHVNWNTNTSLDGRRLRGRTFVVPVVSSFYDSTGTLSGSTAADIQGYGNAFVTAQSASFVVWHRPVEAKPADGSRPAVEQRDGGHGLVTAAAVKDRVSVLSSRRA